MPNGTVRISLVEEFQPRWLCERERNESHERLRIEAGKAAGYIVEDAGAPTAGHYGDGHSNWFRRFFGQDAKNQNDEEVPAVRQSSNGVTLGVYRTPASVEERDHLSCNSCNSLGCSLCVWD